MTTPPRILVVDDDAGQRNLVTAYLQENGFTTVAADSGREALKTLAEQPVDMLVSDVRMPGLSGLETLRQARREFPRLPVLLVTAYADIRDAVEAMRDGAVNYLEKPIDLDELLDCVRGALDLRTPAAPARMPDVDVPPDVIAESPAMRDVLREAALVASTDLRVLISGESGTGKEVLARLIHGWSPRADGPLVIVNAAAIPENLLESELFGHEKGAFTGAVSQRIGRFEDAAGGSIFLDEIGEMSMALQAKLLRVIQDGTFQRVGANEQRRTDARIIAATNRNLEEEVAAGRFREDLFYRLNVIELLVPPLRDRPEDILPMAEHMAAEFSAGAARVSAAVATTLALYDWPGNVRELRNAMERAALMARGRIILPEHLPPRVRQATGAAAVGTNPEDSTGRTMEDIERMVILQTLKEKGYNRSETARALDISRRALIYKLNRLAEQGYQISP